MSNQIGSTNHDLWVNEQLQDVEFAAEFLNTAMEDDNPKVFLLALRKVVDARCKISVICVKTGLSQETINRELAGINGLSVKTLTVILRQSGFSLCFSPVRE